MSKALVLVGSPRGRKSSSTSIGQYLLNQFETAGYKTEILWIRSQVVNDEKIAAMLDAINGADIIILTAPLYDDCQPYIVTKMMEAVSSRGDELSGKRFLPIVNCGFSEHRQITEAAVPIYRSFAKAVGLDWAGSLSIAGGEMLRGAQGISLEDGGKMVEPVRAKLRQIAESLERGVQCNEETMTAFPPFFTKPIIARLMLKMSNSGWKSRAKKNNADVAAQPYNPI